MKIKIAYSPVWMGLVGLGISWAISLSMNPERALEVWWWVSQGGLAVLCAIIALIHGRRVWKREQAEKERVQKILQGRQMNPLQKALNERTRIDA